MYPLEILLPVIPTLSAGSEAQLEKINLKIHRIVNIADKNIKPKRTAPTIILMNYIDHNKEKSIH